MRERTMNSRCLAAALMIIASSIPALCQTIPETGLSAGDLRLPVNASAATLSHVVVYSDALDILAQPATQSVSIADLETPVPNDAKKAAPVGISIIWINIKERNRVKAIRNGAPAVTRVEWEADVKVSGLPVDSNVSRVAQLTAGTATSLLRYVVTNRAKPFTWNVVPPGLTSIVVSTGKANLIFFATMSGDVQTGVPVQLVRVSVKDDVSGLIAPASAFRLSGEVNMTTTGGRPITLEVDGSQLESGTFTGTIDLSAAGSSDIKSFPLTISHSELPKQWLGAALILLGVLISLFVGVVARSVVARSEAMMPARRVLDILDTIEKKLQECGGASQMQSLRNGIDGVRFALSKQGLRQAGYISSVFGSPLRTTTPADYAGFIQRQSDQVNAYGRIVEEGVCKAIGISKGLGSSPAPDKVQLVSDAFFKLDKLAATPPTDIVTIITNVKIIIDALRASLTTLPAAASRKAGDSASLPTIAHLLFTVDSVNIGVWVLWAIITTAVGSGVLIFQNHGFGEPMDLLKCFLWGIGMQVAGQQFQQLTPSAIGTPLGITLPKPPA
jgi:hypothetical protein